MLDFFGGEVDFLVSKNKIVLIEVKYQRRHLIPLSLKNFMRSHSINIGIVITQKGSEIKEVENLRFYFVPAMVL